jgi:CubicO group peptidase (beta-lactamase class C family)
MAAGAHAGAAAAAASPDLATRVAQVVRPYLDRGQTPGISVAVVLDGKVVLAEGYGLSNVAAHSPVRGDTRFDIGSVTKTFTALGVLLLYQESQGTSRPLDLDAPIGNYLRNTRTFKLPPKWSHITTRQLLAMTTGIVDEGDGLPWQAQVAASARDPLLYTPGTKTSYSNASYNLLGQLIEQWTGQKYGAFLQARIFGPLGMSATQELGRSARVAGQAVGYNAPRRGKWPKAAMQNGMALYAAAGMVSTAQDMGTYMTALLGGRLLNPASYAIMWTPSTVPDFGTASSSNSPRGMGWDNVIAAGDGVAEVTKAGDIPGFTSQLILSPSSDSGVFVSINTEASGGPDPSRAVAYRMAESIDDAVQGEAAP